MKKDLYGGFPGARFIGAEELESTKEVIAARSPYRFYGLNLLKQAEILESLCCDIFKRKHTLAVTSGTAALHCALFALGISEGDEVILPAYAWGADLMTILALGAVPVIAPLDDTLGIDVSALDECISERTKAIIAVHMRGCPCDIQGILDIARPKGIKVIEDGAQCVGGKVNDLPIGSIGDISVLSFQYHKLVTSGEGGAVMMNDKTLYEKAHRFHDLGMFRHAGEADPAGPDSMASFGLNYRISELQSAFLIPQLKKMPGILLGLKSSYRIALEELSGICDEYHLHERNIPDNTKRNHAFLCLTAETGEDAGSAFNKLRELGIPVHACSRMDGHHFEIWKGFMEKENRPFRVVQGEKSSGVLDRSLFIEINSLT
ncbi:MAG: aminotransferase class V-fold PLP-dependent enzyme [Nitrospirota bacterium]|nr:aminotransferase class V-fold PLP-dependent enzyme [Nitrospirota bacterium]